MCLNVRGVNICDYFSELCLVVSKVTPEMSGTVKLRGWVFCREKTPRRILWRSQPRRCQESSWMKSSQFHGVYWDCPSCKTTADVSNTTCLCKLYLVCGNCTCHICIRSTRDGWILSKNARKVPTILSSKQLTVNHRQLHATSHYEEAD